MMTSDGIDFYIYGRSAGMPILVLNDPLLGYIPKELLYRIKLYNNMDKVLDVEVKRDYLKALLYLYQVLGLVEISDSSCSLRFPLIMKNEREAVFEPARAISTSIVNYIRRHLPEFINKYNRSSLKVQGFSWEDLNFLLIAGILLDFVVNKSLIKLILSIPGIKAHNRKASWYVWGIEGGLDSKHEYWLYAREGIIGGSLLVFLKGSSMAPIYLRDIDLLILKRFALKTQSPAQVSYELHIPEVDLRRILSHWLSLRLLRKEEGKGYELYKINFPFLISNDYSLIFQTFLRTGNELCNVVLLRQIPDLLKHKYKMGLEYVDDITFLLMMYYASKCYAVDALISEGIISNPPENPQLPWGLCAWCKQ